MVASEQLKTISEDLAAKGTSPAPTTRVLFELEVEVLTSELLTVLFRERQGSEWQRR